MVIEGPNNIHGFPQNLNKVSELEAKSYLDLVVKYRAFKEAVGFDTGVVYHPCGYADVSPSEAFPGSRIIYADREDGAMEVMRKKGFEAHTVDVLSFDPGPVDVLILLNPQIRSEVPASHVKPGGYALSNNYHGNASQLKESADFEFVALIHMKGDSLVYDTEQLEDVWNTVATKEAFEAVTQEGAYARLTKIVEMFGRPIADPIREFQQLQRDIREGKVEGVTDVVDIGKAISFIYNDQKIMIPGFMPNKKGGADDFYVFKRRQVA